MALKVGDRVSYEYPFGGKRSHSYFEGLTGTIREMWFDGMDADFKMYIDIDQDSVDERCRKSWDDLCKQRWGACVWNRIPYGEDWV